jgi:hypothetical protein
MSTTTVKNNTPGAMIQVPISTLNVKMVAIENARSVINLSNIEFYSNSHLTNKVFICSGNFDNPSQAFLEDGTSNCDVDGLTMVAASELKGYGGFSEYKFHDPDMDSFGHTDPDHRLFFWNSNGIKLTGLRIKNRSDGFHDRINSLRITFYTAFDGTQRIDQKNRLTIADRVMIIPQPDTTKVAATIQFESNFPSFSAEGSEFIFKLVQTSQPSPAPSLPASSSPSPSSSAAASTPPASSSAAATPPPSSSAAATTPPSSSSAAATTPPSSSSAAATTPPSSSASSSTSTAAALKTGGTSSPPSTLTTSVSAKPGDNTIIFILVGVLGASIVVAGGVFLYLRSKKK